MPPAYLARGVRNDNRPDIGVLTTYFRGVHMHIHLFFSQDDGQRWSIPYHR